jgi:hypothetical protein
MIPAVQDAIERLRSEGYEPRQMPNEYHLKIGQVNYWPTTGKWHDERGGQTGDRWATLLRRLAAIRAKAAEDREIEELKAEGKIV